MAEKGLQGIDETVQQTCVWINEIADEFHGDRRHAMQILRAFLQTLRDHLPLDEMAQLSAQFPLLVRGIYFEGWDPSRSLQQERTAESFVARFLKSSSIRPMDARDAIASAFRVMQRHVSSGEVDQVLASLPAPVRDLLTRA